MARGPGFVREAEGVHNQRRAEALYEHWEALEHIIIIIIIIIFYTPGSIDPRG